MKSTLIIVFTLFVVHSECEWLDMLMHFTNKTTQFTDFVRQRSHDFKKFYIDSVRNKLTSYMSKDDHHIKAAPKVRHGKKHQAEPEDDIHSDIRQKNANVPRQAPGIEPEDDDEFTFLPEPSTRDLTDDPMIYMTTPQMIAMHGYPAESHTVLTDDGYLLTLHRIPFRSRNGIKEDRRRTVLLHHGLLGSSADWVIPGPAKGLAFILSDLGYDVWMANVRGNTYSRAHISRPLNSFAFWNFSFHEVSQHDLPAIIDYVMQVKGWDVKINYIGHSMGTTILFALLSTKTNYNKVLRAGYALAPVAYMTDIKSPIKTLAKFTNNIEYLIKLLGENEFLPQNTVLKWLSKHACEINNYEEIFCENSMFVLCGHDPKQFNKTLLPRILSHDPAGASTKTLVHYAQIIRNNGRFQMFDYGADENMLIYGSFAPPEYPLHLITLPVALMSAENDWLSSDVDVTNLFVQLGKPLEHYIVPLKEFNHIDFLWAIDAPRLVYKKLIQLLEDGVSIFSYFNPDLVGMT